MTEVCALSEKGVPKCDATTPLLSEAALAAYRAEVEGWLATQA